jgi:hypothetical protein
VDPARDDVKTVAEYIKGKEMKSFFCSSKEASIVHFDFLFSFRLSPTIGWSNWHRRTSESNM